MKGNKILITLKMIDATTNSEITILNVAKNGVIIDMTTKSNNAKSIIKRIILSVIIFT